jgi:hypothetical protein
MGSLMTKLLRTGPCESWGKHCLDIKIGDKWEHLHTDYMCNLEPMIDKITRALEKSNEVKLITR